MKKRLISVILTAIMVLGMTMNVSAGFGRSYTAPKGTPTIDGEIDEVWHSAEWTAVDRIWDTVQDTDSSLYIKLLWDESHLYFLANVYDSTENARNDLVEIYIDQDKSPAAAYEADDHHTRFFVRKTGVEGLGKNSQNDAVSFSKSIATNTFIVEGQLDWKGGTPAVGQQMGLEFMYNDGTMFQAFQEAFRWNVDSKSGDTAAYESTEFFGTLILADAGTPNAANNTLPAKASKVTQSGNVNVNKTEGTTGKNEGNSTNNSTGNDNKVDNSAGNDNKVDNSAGNDNKVDNSAGNDNAVDNTTGNDNATNSETNNTTNDNQNNAENDSSAVNGENSDSDSIDLLWIIIPIVAVVVAIAIIVALVIYKKRKK